MYRKFLPKVEKKRAVFLKSVSKKTLFHQDIVFLVWNVYKKNHDMEWIKEFKKIISLYHPDIMLFQESSVDFKINPIGSYTHYGYIFFSNFSFKQKSFGLLSAAKSKITNFDSVFSIHKEPLLKTPKMILATKYYLNNREKLLVINVHLINFVKTEKFIAQLKQLEELCLSHKGALVIGGDFNTWNKKRINLLFDLAKKLKLKKVEFSSENNKKNIFKQPLDHIFYRGLRLKNSVILDFCKSSDHKPLIAAFCTQERFFVNSAAKTKVFLR